MNGIEVREVIAKFGIDGKPVTAYLGVIRQTDAYTTRLIIDLTSIPGEIVNVGINAKKPDGSVNTNGLIVCPEVGGGQVKKYYCDISNWYTNLPGNVELTVQALATSTTGLNQVFNCSKVWFAIEGTAIELDQTVLPENYKVVSVNGRTGTVIIEPESVGTGASIVKGASAENPNKFQFKSIKGSEHIDVIATENEVEVKLNDAITTDVELANAITNHNTSGTAHGIDVVKQDIANLGTNKINYSNIVDTLTSIESGKPLSAKQGKILKDFIDALTLIVNAIKTDLGSKDDADSLINSIYDLYNFVIGSEDTNLGDVIDGYISSHDNDGAAHTTLFTAVTNRLLAIENIISTIDGETDADTVINKLHEVVTLLNGYAEGTKLIDLLGGKVDKVIGKSLIDDTEIARLLTLVNYDDTAVLTHIANADIHITTTEKTQIQTNKTDITTINTTLPNKANASEVLPNAHNTDVNAHSDIRTLISEAKAIAEGKSRARVFPTLADAQTWIASNSSQLLVGDNIYIEAIDTPDYWWNGTSLKALEGEKVSLVDYYKKTETYSASEVDTKLIHNHDTLYEPKNTNIQTHVTSAHAPSNAQKNSDITKAEIEAKLIGVIETHSHPFVSHNHDTDYYKKTETYTKTEVDNKVASVYRFMGTRETYAQLLETVTNPSYGDTYNIQDTGDNYAWSDFGGVGNWDKLSGTVDLTNYVQKDGTKVLSTNDLTNTLKTNYDNAYTHSQTAHAPSGAQANVIEGVQVNGVDLTVTNKKVNVVVPSAYDDTAVAGRVTALESSMGDVLSALATING
jgi:hypothetical protein